jgi:hypothetical protein
MVVVMGMVIVIVIALMIVVGLLEPQGTKDEHVESKDEVVPIATVH